MRSQLPVPGWKTRTEPGPADLRSAIDRGSIAPSIDRSIDRTHRSNLKRSQSAKESDGTKNDRRRLQNVARQGRNMPGNILASIRSDPLLLRSPAVTSCQLKNHDQQNVRRELVGRVPSQRPWTFLLAGDRRLGSAETRSSLSIATNRQRQILTAAR